MAEHWEEKQKLEGIVERRRMEGSSLNLDAMQKVPELVVNERTSQGKRVKSPKEKKKVPGWSIEEMKEKPKFAVEEDTEDMRKWRGLSQSEMDQCWRNLAERMEEEVMKKYKVEGKREAFRGRGGPLEWRRVRENKIYKIRKWREDCWARIFSLSGEYNLQRLHSKQDESTEEDEMKQQQRMKITKDLTKKIRSKARMDAESRWWVTELVAAD